MDNGDRWTITGNDIYTYYGYLQTINSGQGSWDNLVKGLNYAAGKNKGKGGSMAATLNAITISSSFAGESDFDNWWSNLKTGVSLTVHWALGTGRQNYVFKNDPVANAFRNSSVVKQERDFWYSKVNAGEKKITDGVTDFKGEHEIFGGNFGIREYIKAGFDPMEQFVGSFSPEITSDGKVLTFKLLNTTSMQSLLYGFGPNWLRSTFAPGGNITQTLIFTEPIDFNRIKNNSP